MSKAILDKEMYLALKTAVFEHEIAKSHVDEVTLLCAKHFGLSGYKDSKHCLELVTKEITNRLLSGKGLV